MKKVFLLPTIISLSFLQFVIAQNQTKIDSLKQVLEKEKEDTNKVNTLNALGWQLSQTGDYNQAKKYAEDALTLAQSLRIGTRRGWAKGEAYAYTTIGIIYDYQGNYPEALKSYFACLKIGKEIGDKHKIAYSYNNIGIIYKKQGNYPEALKNYLASLKIKEEIGDKRGIASSYGNIGRVYTYQGNYPEALKNYFAALKLLEEIGDKQFLAYTYGNIGVIYDLQSNYPEALKNHFAALKIQKEIGDKQGIAASYVAIGDVYGHQDNHLEELKNYFAALKIQEEIGDKDDITISYINIGEIYSEQKKFTDAIQNLNKGLSLSKEIGNKDDIRGAYLSLAQAFAAMNDYKKAYEYHQLYSDIKDTLFNEESSKQIAQMKEQYESDKKDQQIVVLNKDNELQSQKAKQQRIIKNVFIGSFIAALIIAFLFLNRFRLKQKSARSLEEKNKIIADTLDELKQRQQQLVQSEKMASVGVLTAGIAHEINNPINFVSSSIKPLKRNVGDLLQLINQYETTVTAKQLKEEFREVESFRKSNDINVSIAEIDELLTGIESGATRTAEVVKGLRNFSRLDEDVLKKADLNEGIESTLVLLQTKLNQQNIEVIKSLTDIPDIECYPGQLNQVFMNVIINAMDAIGRDGKIFIITSTENNHVKISIRDTGKGMSEDVKQKIFDPFFTTKDVGKGTGLGLSISYGIIEKHNGKIAVKSEPGKGTEFIITLPIQK